MPDVAVSNGGSSIALGDVDGDGDLDIVSSNYDNLGASNSSPLNVRLNKGLNSGNFVAAATAPNPAAGTRPGNVALGDVDGDGDLDLLAINSAGASSNAVVNVRLNNGTGTFTAPATNPNPSVGPYTWFLVTGDLDGDGDLDILTAGNSASNPSLGVVHILLNQGLNSGNFVPPTSDPTVSMGANSLGTIAVGDVDGDGDLDFAAGSYTTVLLFLNNGAGRFAAPASNATFSVTGGGGIISVALGDVDADGDLDLLTANATVGSNGRATGLVNVRLNSGLHTGHFVAPSTQAEVPIDNVPRNLVLGDVDSDGDLDLVTANEGYSPFATTMSVRLNDGIGHFMAPATNADPTVGGSPRCVMLGDVDGDGDLDAVTINTVLNGAQSTLSIRRNEPAALYSATVAPATGTSGSKILLTGTNFTGATAVSFNGALAPAGTFTVTSDNSISATVPQDARSGPVYVTTPHGVLTTATPFGVTVLGASSAMAMNVALYPNPTRTFFTVEVPALAGATQVQATLLNALGQPVATHTSALPAAGTRFTLPVATMSKGIYLLRLQAGLVTIIKRVVVE
ncbi:hypothetical protein GCM10011383_32010 [Hymenobacter cavernae]|uniref:Secretion system C-terminal sorting domain-containing protein n=2 Tax=Hymenobacter cavernae TaxID=2044852 RepID=A0ABQ1UFW4_9BACT|nr:hypothetical protein GCM10011383_32010 [Hymenobacter cavernae]